MIKDISDSLHVIMFLLKCSSTGCLLPNWKSSALCRTDLSISGPRFCAKGVKILTHFSKHNI